jgi:hypothetical protein
MNHMPEDTTIRRTGPGGQLMTDVDHDTTASRNSRSTRKRSRGKRQALRQRTVPLHRWRRVRRLAVPYLWHPTEKTIRPYWTVWSRRSPVVGDDERR